MQKCLALEPFGKRLSNSRVDKLGDISAQCGDFPD
jgi:hypothetical protein